MHLLEKSVINKIWLQLPVVFDGPIIMIRPGGLLLVVPTTYLQSKLFQAYGLGIAKKK